MTAAVLTVSQMSYELATDLITAAHDDARDNGLALAVAVVDRGGQLVAAGRMDGAAICAMPLARDKAYTAAACEAPTSAWSVSTQPGGPDWGMHTAMGGQLTVFPGGVPVVIDGEVIGGLGVSGGECAEDDACASSALEALGIATGPSE